MSDERKPLPEEGSAYVGLCGNCDQVHVILTRGESCTEVSMDHQSAMKFIAAILNAFDELSKQEARRPCH